MFLLIINDGTVFFFSFFVCPKPGSPVPKHACFAWMDKSIEELRIYNFLRSVDNISFLNYPGDVNSWANFRESDKFVPLSFRPTQQVSVGARFLFSKLLSATCTGCVNKGQKNSVSCGVSFPKDYCGIMWVKYSSTNILCNKV